MIFIFFFLIAYKSSVFYACRFKLFWLVGTTHAQTTTFPFFGKRDSFCWQNRKSFITIQLLSFSYMSQFGFVIISFIWCDLQKKQRWPFRSSRQCREYVYSIAVYQKYLTRLEELITFEPWRENYHF